VRIGSRSERLLRCFPLATGSFFDNICGMLRNALRTFVVTCALALAYCGNAQVTNKHTSDFNQQWLKALVSIEVVGTNGAGRPIGTGFLIGTPGGHAGLVTAKHVVFEDDGNGPLVTNLAYRLNNRLMEHTGIRSVCGQLSRKHLGPHSQPRCRLSARRMGERSRVQSNRCRRIT
jgi:hypothetical protein